MTSQGWPVVLEPGARTNIQDAFRPPHGYAFDGGVLCTYSVALGTLLSLPAALVAQTPEDLEAVLQPANAPKLLASVRRVFGRLVVFCEESRIHAHAGRSVPCMVAEAEGAVREVRSPRDGAFHPKLWLLRFAPDGGSGPVRLRLAVSSKNLTPDRSWDAGVVLEGVVGTTKVRQAPEAGLLRVLPDQCRTPLAPDRLRLIRSLAGEVERVDWRPPQGLGNCKIHVTGLGSPPWRPPRSERLVVIAPFADARALERLRKSTDHGLALVSLPEALDEVSRSGDLGFERVCVLGSPDQGGAAEKTPAISGLHAKVYVWDNGRRTRVALGSANATTAALEGRNVEVMAEFDCTAALKGGAGALLDGELSIVLADYAPTPTARAEEPARDTRRARRALAGAGLVLRCNQAEAGTVDVVLVSDQPLDPGVARAYPALRFWPVTVTAEQAAPCIDALVDGKTAPFSRPLAVHEVTGFVSFGDPGAAGEAFTLNLPVEGLSEDERLAALAAAVLPTERSFFDFVRMLLDGADEAVEIEPGRGIDGSEPRVSEPSGAAGHPAVLESLVRCAADRPDRIAALEAVVGGMVRAEAGVPERFRELWAALQAARPSPSRRSRTR